MSELSINSDPIQWLEKAQPIKTGDEAIDFIESNGSKEIWGQIREKFISEWSSFVTTNPEYKDRVLNEHIERFLRNALMQPIVAPLGSKNIEDPFPKDANAVLCCYFNIWLAEPEKPNYNILFVGLVLDEKTRRFIDVVDSFTPPLHLRRESQD